MNETPKHKHQHNKVFVVDGARTPFLKTAGVPGPFSAAELAIRAGRPLLLRQNFKPSDFDEVILGCVMPSPHETNIARVVALRLGCGHDVTAWTVQRNCASGMQALDSAMQHIQSGRAQLILAGGVEAMSRAPLLYSPAFAHWLGKLNSSRGMVKRLKQLVKFRPALLKPVISLIHGLTDPVIGLSMGQTAENLAYRFNIDRAEMDAYAMQSHQRLAAAQDQGFLHEIEALFSASGEHFLADNGVRRDSSMERLGKLRAVFDRHNGLVTAGNSAQITDGAALLILASAQAVADFKLPVLGQLIDCTWAGVDPAQMGLGPVHAITPLLANNELALSDIDYWEINEAFATQVLACVKALADDSYCRDELGLEAALGQIDASCLNIDGGGVSLGHPVGASGARIVLHLLHVLARKKARRGIASLCIGGGQGGAMMVERHVD